MPPQSGPGRRLAGMVLVAATAASCGSTGAIPTRIASSSAIVTTTAPTATASPSSAVTATLADCGPARDSSALHVVHHFSVSPDDITVDAGGRLWVTAREANLLIGMDASGGAVTTQDAPGGPEGVATDATALYVAQQNLNSVLEIAPTLRTVVTLPNHTNNAGIDGIASDVAGHRVLVPDSPTGELFAVRLSGTPTPELLASGLGRPVAATTDGAGDIIVASESSPGLTIVTPAGAKRSLGHFTDLDEVVMYAGLLYVTELDHRDVLAVDPASGASVAVAVNLPAPQGLAVTATGTLEIVDSTTNTLYSVPACARPR
ncbi:MAG TPA: hypothetical protein VIO13_12850 [Candidatus Dormibacteraeota bacterium]